MVSWRARPRGLRVEARDRPDRLAVHYDWSLVVLVEDLATSDERLVEAKLTGKALERSPAKMATSWLQHNCPITSPETTVAALAERASDHRNLAEEHTGLLVALH